MDDTGDLCACIACSALCGLCCAVAAEEDRRERAQNGQRVLAGEDGVTYLDPVQVHKQALSKMNTTPNVQEAVYAPKRDEVPINGIAQLPPAV